MSLCSSVENVPMVSSNIEQHNEIKSGHILRLELQDMLNSHGMRISQFQADSDVSIEKHSNVQASNVVPEMNHVLSSKVDEVKKLPYPVVNSIAKRIWSSYGLSEVLSSDNGFFLFTFDSVDHATNVLERAPWHMANRTLVLKHDLARVLVWVRLYNVPLEYWTIKGLSCVASAIRVPLQADHTTFLRKRLSYARVCVEIDASKTLIKEYDLRCPKGLFITISPDYEWIPLKGLNDPIKHSTLRWLIHQERIALFWFEVKVDDLRYSGMHYTWSNQCPENLIMRKLDRVLVNEKWNLNFPLSEARFLPSGMSDHSPMVVKVIWQ
uniref:DUF4283 domain-containing protein n=1 Tax=Populus trichocarpa TaxID=3694 RepID=A0A2K1R9N2_POPTR